jgi:hypothetical protein
MSLTTDLSEPVGALRLMLGDTVAGQGVKPDGSNFSDAEWDYFWAQGGDLWGALALACDALAAVWRTQPTFSADGLRIEREAIARGWAEAAVHFRAQSGAKIRQIQREGGA